MGDNFKKWIERLRVLFSNNGVQYAIPFVIITLLCHTWFHVTIEYLNAATLEWWVQRHPVHTIDWVDSCITSFNDIGICSRMTEQLSSSVSKASHHFWVMVFFQNRYFSLLSTSFAAVTFLAPFAILLGKDGWDGMSPSIRSAMLGLACNAAFFGSFPSWAKMEDNIRGNKLLYIKHSNLAEDIKTFILTKDTNIGCIKETVIDMSPEKVFIKGGIFQVTEGCTPEVFILVVDGKLSALNDVFLEADARQVSNGNQKFIELTSGERIETDTTPVHDEVEGHPPN